MATNVGDLGVVLTANIAQFQSALRQAEQSSKSFSNEAQRAFSQAKNAVTGFVGAWAGIEGVKAVFGKLNAVGELKDIAAGLQISTQTLQKLEYAGITAGVSVDNFRQLLTRVSDASAEFATGNKDIIETFRKLGITSVDLEKPEQMLFEILDGLNKLPTAADKTQTAISLAGSKGAQALLRLASEGVDNLTDSMREAEQSGAVLTKEMVEKADEAGEKLDKLWYIFDSKLKVAIADNADSIVQFGNAIEKILPAAINLVSYLAAKFVGLGEGIGEGVAKMMGYESGEDALKRYKITLTELTDQRNKLVKTYTDDSSVKAGRPSMEMKLLADRIRVLQQQKEAMEKVIGELGPSFGDKPASAKPASKPEESTGTKGKRTGAGAKSGSKSGSETYEDDNVKTMKEVAELLAKSDQSRIDALEKQRAELERQKKLWTDIDTSQMTAEEQSNVNAQVEKYNGALQKVNAEMQQIAENQPDNKQWIEASEAFEKYYEAQKKSAQAIRESIDPLEKMRAELQKVAELVESGHLTPDEFIEFYKQLNEKGMETVNWAKEMGATFQSAFEDAILSGKSFSSVLGGIGQDIARTFLRQGVTNPLMEMLFGKGGKSGGGGGMGGGLLGDLFKSSGIGDWFKGMASDAGSWIKGLFGFANGGIVGDGIPRYATGGVVGMSPQGAFIAGEAGPEGILPLKRINGKLGVMASGSGGNSVINNVTVNVQGGNTNEQTGNVVAEKVMRAIAQQEIGAARRTGGSLNPMAIGH